MLQFLSIKSRIEQAALTHFLFINDSRGGLCYKPSGFFRSPRHYCKFYHSLFISTRQINDDDDDDDDDDTISRTSEVSSEYTGVKKYTSFLVVASD